MLNNFCILSEGKFVEPCDSLLDCLENDSTDEVTNGLWKLIHYLYGYTSLSFIVLKTTKYPEGIALNFCPFCGSKFRFPVVNIGD